jgi:hypothetical protein
MRVAVATTTSVREGRPVDLAEIPGGEPATAI